MDRLETKYRQEIVGKLKEELGLQNIMQVPKLEKIVINMGVGDAIGNIKGLDVAAKELSLIAGQKAIITRAKQSISNFKLRKGMPIGCCVTLRGRKMYEFFDRLINVALPRVRDFRGVPVKSFDGRGNYTLGIKDQVIFPEIDYGKIEVTRGMNVCIATTAKKDEHARALLNELGMPFRRS